jgi:polar amino acid transport system substrate-binding protein
VSALIAVCAAAVLAAGCSSSGNAGADKTPQGQGPAATTGTGTSRSAQSCTRFTIPQQTGIPPLGFVGADNKLTGVLPDLTNAIGQVMGCEVNNQATAWENALLGLQSGKFDGVPGANITAERLQKFDFALLMLDHYGFLQMAAGSQVPNTMDALCGLTIGTTSGNVSVAALQDQSAKCTASGKKAIDVKTFPDGAATTLALTGGHVDLTTDGMATIGYQALQSNGKLRVTGPSYLFAQIGWAAQKGSGNAEKVAAAFNKLIADGTYRKILDKYGLGSDAMKQSVVNPTPLP